MCGAHLHFTTIRSVDVLVSVILPLYNTPFSSTIQHSFIHPPLYNIPNFFSLYTTHIHIYVTYVDIECVSLHRMMSQLQRNNALEAYKSRRVSIMIATDVAGRGLDIPR